MSFQATLYIPRKTPVHAFDARGKIACLLVYSVAIFFAESWSGTVLFALAAVALALLARLPWGYLCKLLLPVAVLAAFAVAFNCVQAAVWQQGLLVGLLVAVRMLALALASFVVCFTTTSMQLVGAFMWYLRPLGVLRVPVGDVSLVLSLALRFIPLIAQQLALVRNAQAARAACLSAGSAPARIKAWGAVFIPLFVGLFRRADSMAQAMDARCYGFAGAKGGPKQTSLAVYRWSMCQLAACIAFIALMVSIAALL